MLLIFESEKIYPNVQLPNISTEATFYELAETYYTNQIQMLPAHEKIRKNPETLAIIIAVETRVLNQWTFCRLP